MPRNARNERLPKERDIVREIMRALGELPGCYAIKTHGDPFTRAGTPDIIGAYRGRAFAFEVKRPGGKPTALQVHELERWRQAGAVVGVVTSAESAIRALRDAEEEDEG